MARFATTNSPVNNSVDQGLHTTNVTFNGAWSQTDPNSDAVRRRFNWGLSSVSENDLESPVGLNCSPNGSYSHILNLLSDRNYQVRAQVNFHQWDTVVCEDLGFVQAKFGSTTQFKTWAVTATTSAPTSSAITKTTATIACNYVPNTDASTATVKLQYRVQGDPDWIDAGVADTVSGYSQLNISRNLTGLTCGTTYEFRLTMTRTTSNAQTLNSGTVTFLTSACDPPADPTIITNAASSVGSFVATLNGTVNPNGTSTTFRFVYGNAVGGPYPNETTLQGPNSGNANVAFSQDLEGLVPGTTYYYKAKAIAGGNNFLGSEVSFITSSFAPLPGVPPDKPVEIDSPLPISKKRLDPNKLKIEGILTGLLSGKLEINHEIHDFSDKEHSLQSIKVTLGVGGNVINVPSNAEYMLIVPTDTSHFIRFRSTDIVGEFVDQFKLFKNNEFPFLIPVDINLASTVTINNPEAAPFDIEVYFL